MKSKCICAILLSLIINVSAGNLDPMKGCVDPGTRDELQSSIDVFQADIGTAAASPRTLTLCKDTKIKFKKDDPRIYISIPADKSFLLECEEYQTCVIYGGNDGRHKKDSREQVGSGGFLEFSSGSSKGYYLYFHGIKFINFGASNDGGVMKFHVNGLLYITYYKCHFINNYAKFQGGAIFVNAMKGRFSMTLKDCKFDNNESDGFGGAVGVRNFDCEEEIVVRDTMFYQNWAKTHGGALALGGFVKGDYRKIFIYNSHFKDNKASIDGAGIWMFEMRVVYIKNTVFKDGTVGRYGEAYFAVESNIDTDEIELNDDSIFEFGSSSRVIVTRRT